MDNEGTNDYFFQSPVAKKLVDLIEQNADELTNHWLSDVRKNASMPTYGLYQDEKELYRRAFTVLNRLGKWISRDAPQEEIQRYWTDLGKQRREEGFALSEIVQSLFLIRRHLWRKIESDGLLDTAFDLYQAMELHNRVMQFFERAIYYTVLGFESGKE